MLSKFLKKIIRTRIAQFLHNTGQINKNQHGFLSGRSCLSQLLAHRGAILNSLESKSNVDVIYLDFAKAFDKVDHGILLHKVRNMGITKK